jgi:hemoglobin/transferrin/lactoferrin receptor protein
MGKSKNPFGNYSFTKNYTVEYLGGKDSAVANDNNLIQKGSGYNQLNIMEKVLYKPEDNITHLLNILF